MASSNGVKKNNLPPIKIALLSKKYQIVIPKPMRVRLGLKSHDEVLLVAYNDEVRLMKKPKDWLSYMRGLGKQAWSELGGTQAYLDQERKSWEKGA